MGIVRWSPFQELACREMQSLASHMTSRFLPFVGEDRFVPALDVTTRGDDVIVRVELPGIDADKDVQISMQKGIFFVLGKRTAEREEEKAGYHLRGMRYGSFERSLPLPEGVTAEAVSAEYCDGILEIKVAGGAKQVSLPEARKIAITRASAPAAGEGGSSTSASAE